MADLTHTAVGTWSGGRFMRFGVPLDDGRLAALVRPGGGIDTVLTADAYGAGEADALLACAARTATATTSGWPPSAASSGWGSPRSTCCCSTTRTAWATRARSCGTRW